MPRRLPWSILALLLVGTPVWGDHLSSLITYHVPTIAVADEEQFFKDTKLVEVTISGGKVTPERIALMEDGPFTLRITNGDYERYQVTGSSFFSNVGIHEVSSKKFSFHATLLSDLSIGVMNYVDVKLMPITPGLYQLEFTSGKGNKSTPLEVEITPLVPR